MLLWNSYWSTVVLPTFSSALFSCVIGNNNSFCRRPSPRRLYASAHHRRHWVSWSIECKSHPYSFSPTAMVALQGCCGSHADRLEEAAQTRLRGVRERKLQQHDACTSEAKLEILLLHRLTGNMCIYTRLKESYAATVPQDEALALLRVRRTQPQPNGEGYSRLVNLCSSWKLQFHITTTTTPCVHLCIVPSFPTHGK